MKRFAFACIVMVIAIAECNAATLDETKAKWNAVLASSTNPRIQAEARMRLAYLATKSNAPLTDQISSFLAVANKYPHTPAARECLLRAAYLKDKADKSQGPAAFDDVARRYPGTKEAAEANFRKGMACQRDKTTIDAALASLKSAVNTPAADPYIRQRAAAEAGYVHIMKYFASMDETDLESAIDYATSVLPNMRDPEMRVRARLVMGECYLLLEQKPLKKWPPDEAEFNEKQAKHYPQLAEREYRAALAEKGSDYQRLLALYGLAYSQMYRYNSTAAEAIFSSIINSLAGKTLREKSESWRKLGLVKLPNGQTAGEGHQAEWKDFVMMASYWQAVCLSRQHKSANARIIYQQIIDEFGSDPNPNCLIEAIKRDIAEMYEEEGS